LRDMKTVKKPYVFKPGKMRFHTVGGDSRKCSSCGAPVLLDRLPTGRFLRYELDESTPHKCLKGAGKPLPIVADAGTIQAALARRAARLSEGTTDV
jgi:hypothetical protein